MFFHKIISAKKIQSIFTEAKENDGIYVGELTDFDPEKTAQCFNIWTRQIDKIIQLDRELNQNQLSWRGQKALRWRGVTYPEFGDLFSTHIPEEDFSFYPIFGQLKRRGKAGIFTEKERAEFTHKYEYNLEGYISMLIENGFEPLLTFFFSFAKRGAYLPHHLMKMHLHLTGATGSGKTMLLCSLFFEMTKRMPKASFILIDPHGDISEITLRNKHFGNTPERVVYINPSFRKGFTPSFNPFELSDISPHTINHFVDNLIVAFEEVLSRDDKFSEVQINTLEKSLYFLFQKKQNPTILYLKALLDCEESLFMEAQIHDPHFFNEAFAKHTNKTRMALSSRIQRMLNSPLLYNLLGAKSSFSLERGMNTGKVMIFNLSTLPELTAQTFSKFLVASIKSITRKRQKNNFLCPTYLFMDEAHLTTSGSWNVMLEQLRGFGLHLVVSHQFPQQLGEQLTTVRHNTAIKIFSLTDEQEDSNSVAKVPTGVRPLNDFEFYLKCRNRRMQIFKIPKKFVSKRKKYEMSKKEFAFLKEMQLERYYRKIEQKNGNQIQEEEPINQFHTTSNPIPPFALNLK